MTSVRELLEREQFFDAAVLRNGFTDYMRDYEISVGAPDGPPHTDLHRSHFVGTVVWACCRTALRDEAFAMSLADEFVLSDPDYPEIDDPEGYIWGVRFSDAYPGLEYFEDSELAERWTARLGREMHEVLLETNAFGLRLVFADLRYEYLGRADPTPAGLETTPSGRLPRSASMEVPDLRHNQRLLLAGTPHLGRRTSRACRRRVRSAP